MARFSIDSEQRKIGSRACAIVHYRIDSDRWLYSEGTDPDSGGNCILELSENNRWQNHRIECLIRGTRSLKELKREDAFSFALEVSAIKQALSTRHAFVLFYVDVISEDVYYLPIQDYFIENKDLFEKLNGEQDTVSVHIPKSNLLGEDDHTLRRLARSMYADGPGEGLKRYLQERLFAENWESE